MMLYAFLEWNIARGMIIDFLNDHLSRAAQSAVYRINIIQTENGMNEVG